MKAMNLFLGLGLVIGLAGCSSSYVRSDYDREANFANYKTFDWMSQPNKAGDNPFTQNTLLEKRIKNAVDNELESKGYQKRTTGDPDFLIVYSFGVENKLDATPYGYDYGGRYYRPYGYGYRGHYYRPYRYWSSHYGRYGFGFRGGYYAPYGYGYLYAEPYVQQFKEGTLILDFIDPQSNQLVWRGWYVDAVDDGEIGETKINKALKHILEKFPPGS
ncbi:MAG: DUF4136 domain-containing protein [Bacteroidota bacterium]